MSESDLIRREDAIRAAERTTVSDIRLEDVEAVTGAVAQRIQALDAVEPKLLNDGTLVVTVDDATKVTRVLVEDDKHRGGLYYEDEPTAEDSSMVDEPQTERNSHDS